MIPLVDLRAQYQAIKPDIDGAIIAVLNSTQFIGGPEVRGFEEEFAAFCGARHAVGVGNGTDAISIALKALSIGPGDEVITTANTFIATAEAVSSIGATPVFVDVDPVYYNMDPRAFESAVTSRSRAVIPVHLYGQPSPMGEIRAIADRHGLRVVEDAAQAHGATFMGQPVGTLGDVACFSFYPGKNLGAYGDAGAVVTDDDELAKSMRMLRDHGRTGKYLHDTIGANSRLDALQAAILRVKLSHLAEWTAERRRLADLYSRSFAISACVVPPAELPDGQHVYHLYVVQAEDRDGLRDHLAAEGIATGIHYPVPLHLQPAYEHLGYARGQFPVAEALADRIVSLPIYAELGEEGVDYIVDKVEGFFTSRR